MAAASNADCIFCKIVDKKIPGQIVSEDDHHMALNDISPQAPTHILVIPKDHKPSIAEWPDDLSLGRLFQFANAVAKMLSIDSYRLVVNTGADAGQTVFHLHIHLLAGRLMNWPPG